MIETIRFRFGDPAFGFLGSRHPVQLRCWSTRWGTREKEYPSSGRFVLAWAFLDEGLHDAVRLAAEDWEATELFHDEERRLRPDWLETRVTLMRTALALKFNWKEHLDLAVGLDATEDRPLASLGEGPFWSAEHAGKSGENRLGRLLEERRAKNRAWKERGEVEQFDSCATWQGLAEEKR